MKRTVHCPTCRRPVSWEDAPYRPFCSERCRLMDLGRWADGVYRVAGEDAGPDAAAPNPASETPHEPEPRS
ncbi:MAG TPA: DNA gyrase inhibitor YacG [Acidobacteriota bacterium]|nr:DNA gyrase inhibitor YacG [Acidobacteriota bacterium]HOT00199.1 DNA gyrase inhibitor YacG [Acidobacteriota bacterium]HQF85632.1 DNA gyrase inhibitor YacG [Acidobacteriota bacterium]HQG91124.1 DNA gyrase inhibitor YacG [Acidobacteriota bacterium]HQK86531.1 DNA gyrase inhibitor YacG [Acidobacteriota bacterium]